MLSLASPTTRDDAVDVGLAELLDFLALDGSPAAPAPSLRASAARAWAWLQRTSRRAAVWGAVPSTRVAASEVL